MHKRIKTKETYNYEKDSGYIVSITTIKRDKSYQLIVYSSFEKNLSENNDCNDGKREGKLIIKKKIELKGDLEFNHHYISWRNLFPMLPVVSILTEEEKDDDDDEEEEEEEVEEEEDKKKKEKKVEEKEIEKEKEDKVKEELEEFFKECLKSDSLKKYKSFQRYLGVKLKPVKEKKGLMKLFESSDDVGGGGDIKLIADDGFKHKVFHEWKGKDILQWLNDLELYTMIQVVKKLVGNNGLNIKDFDNNKFYDSIIQDGVVESIDSITMRDYKIEVYIMRSEYLRLKNNKRYEKRRNINENGIYECKVNEWDSFHVLSWLKEIDMDYTLFEEYILLHFYYGFCDLSRMKKNKYVNTLHNLAVDPSDFRNWYRGRSKQIDEYIDLQYREIEKRIKIKGKKEDVKRHQVLLEEYKLLKKDPFIHYSTDYRLSVLAPLHLSYLLDDVIKKDKFLLKDYYPMISKLLKSITGDTHFSITKVFKIAEKFVDSEVFVKEFLKKTFLKFVPDEARLPIKLILTNIERVTNPVTGFVCRVYSWLVNSVQYGFFHTVMLIGPFLFEWNDAELCFPKMIDLLDYSQEGVGMGGGGRLEKDALITVDVGDILKDVKGEKKRKKIIKKLMNVVGKVCTKWNTQKTYNTTKCNCQHYVNDMILCLNTEFKNVDLRIKEKGAMKHFINHLKKTGKNEMYFKPSELAKKTFTFSKECPKNKRIIFKTHEQLDKFVRDNFGFIYKTEFLEERRLLKAFDRAFWLKFIQTNSPTCKDLNCPFGDPRFTGSFALSSNVRQRLLDNEI